MRLRDLDYFRTKDNIIFLVKGYYHPRGKVFAYPVYWPDPSGERIHPKLLKVLNLTNISRDHTAYHVKKFGSIFNPRFNSFAKTLRRKWSSIQVAKDLLSTIRFVYKNNEISPNPIKSGIKKPTQIKGIIVSDFDTNFMPRTFKIKSRRKIYQIVTYFWAFQEAVSNKDQVIITGNLHKDGKTISIDNSKSGIKIIN